MARVRSETVDEVRLVLATFKQATGNETAVAAAHLAGAVEALRDEIDSEDANHFPRNGTEPQRNDDTLCRSSEKASDSVS